MKKSMYAAMIVALLIAGCDSKNTSSSTSVEDSLSENMNRSDTGTGMNHSDMSSTAAQPVTDAGVNTFVKKALSGGMMEVELGTMAANNAQSQRVKDFGAMMVTDHSQAGNELKAMATSNAIEVPLSILPEHQMHIDMLKNKKGAAFDKAYMDMMVKDHKKDISEYSKASKDLAVPAYKDFASKTLPVLEKHLDSAQAIHKNL